MTEIIKTYKCPICGKLEKENKYRPFCSKRCADIDLGNWFSESYTVPVVEMDEKDLEQLQEQLEEAQKDKS
ncbi:MAG: DNA gyrase inhibitor YacG [Lactobacillus sp.]|jgi:endogenous inhibitor of DNA gyrase (YacG/DUF329 family)|nr:DNA gyrase inhibitor YacG [Lactobacillus sp.]